MRRPDAAGPTVRIGGVGPVPAVLASLGADPARTLAAIGVDIALFDDPDNLIPATARLRILNECAQRTGCPHFGLLVGQRSGLDSLGLVGLLAKYSPDVGSALRSLAVHLHVHARGASIGLSVNGDLATLTYTVTIKGGPTEQLGDGALAMAFNALGQLCGAGWKAAEVRFVHRRPVDTEPYRRFFKSPLVFDAEANAVLFAAQWLAHPLPEADQELGRVLAKRIGELESQFHDDFPEQVRGVIRAVLLTDHTTADGVASLFGVHGRTLRRRLAEYGTRFRALLDECRFEAATQMLDTSDLDAQQIAALLGYADASAFTRAFRRWSGTTPARSRQDRALANTRRARAGPHRLPSRTTPPDRNPA